METTLEKKKTKTSFKDAEVGSVFSETQFYILEKKVGDRCQLKNEQGQPVTVDKNYVEQCLVSAEQFTEERKLNKTDLANTLLNNPGVAMTVSFNMKVKEKDVVEEVMRAYEGSNFKSMETALKKAIKKGLEGEERVITGYFYGEPDEFGRVKFIDMKIERESSGYDNRIRNVDPRSMNWSIVRGVKSVLK